MAKKKPASKKANTEAPKRMSAASATKTKKEVRQGSRTPKMAKRAGFPSLSLPQGWFSALVFFLVCVLLFYPPYFRGLFFDKELLPTHVITALIYGLVWVDKFRRRDLRFIQNPLDYAVLAYAGAYLLSLIGAVHIGDAIKGFLKALNYFMIYWMVTQVVQDYRRYETVLQVLFASALGVAAIGIAAATGYSHYPGAFEDGHILSTLQYHNTTAVYMGVMAIAGITLWIRANRLPVRLIYGISTAVMVLVAVAAISKGGWIVLILGGLLLLAGMPGIFRLRAMYTLGGAFAAALIGAVYFTPAISARDNAMAFRGLAVLAITLIMLELAWEGLLFLHRRVGTKAVVAAVLLLVIAAVAQIPFRSANIDKLLPSRLITEAKEVGDIENSSYVTRLEFNYTALRIVKDHPIFGTGAGGWNALYHQYLGFPFWTTEVHDHFLQVWVEAGTVGFVAFLAMWVFLAYNLWRLHRVRPPQDEWAMNWGVASAALAFGAHAAIDFDLSLAAMAVVLWSLFALVAAGTNLSCPGIRITRKEPGWLPAVAVVTALILLIPAASFARANTWVERGAQAANAKKIDEAEEAMNRAINLNPWDGRFDAYLAKICAVKYKVLTENKHPQAGVYLTAAKKHAQDSERLRPYDLQNLKELLQTYSLLGDAHGQLHILEQCLKTNPLDSANYLNLADAYLTVGKYYLDQKKPDEARRYLAKVAQVSNQLDRKITTVKARYPQQTSNFTRPAELDAKVAEARSLLSTLK